MKKKAQSSISKLLLFVFVVCAASISAAAQTTAFTYQGRLTDSTVPLGTGTYDFQFALFDANDNQIGAAQTKSGVQVTNGVFTVALDFGVNAFASGADRFLQIAVKRTTDSIFTPLTPRQPLTSSPFAVQSLNAQMLGGFSFSQFIQQNDSRLSDDRNPLAGSANYIQNQTAGAQAGNFNLSGNGILGGILSANSVNAATNFKIGNAVVFSTPNQTSVVAGQSANHAIVSANSAFFGYRAGFSSNSFSFSNTFIGSEAGQATTVGWNNTFVGKHAGYFNVSGTGNSAFGSDAGKGSGSGAASFNSIFGYEAGVTVNGNRNSFFGYQAGRQNQTAVDNAFFGYLAGTATTANNNSFFGSGAGDSNTTGANNVFVGRDAGTNNTTGSFNTAVGGDSGGGAKTGSGNTLIGYNAGGADTTISNNTALGYNAGNNSLKANNTFLGANTDAAPTVTHSTAIGADASVNTSNTVVLGTQTDTVQVPNALYATNLLQAPTVNAVQLNAADITVNGDASFYGIYLGGHTGPGTGNELCINNAGKVVVCSSSSLRYKTNVFDYAGGLDVLFGLRPITFDWKADGTPDIGFAAEEVEKADPSLVFYNKDGRLEGVKYNRISLVLVNSIKEQQAQIERQQRQIEELKTIVCSIKPDAPLCRAK
ncbi:MAG TPA: tail fiber domain-containing protein [Pyrinomonadaceae bacterium]|jgi:hypothetical protein